jgi:NADP-dependent 3-hydroxy acid dehydrogenase YdfG
MTKHVLITGGSDGIGKLTAKKLVGAGYKVSILSHDADKTKAAAKELGCQFVVADVAVGETAASAVKMVEDQNGPIDILINNAGIWLSRPIDEVTPDEMKRVIEINTLGTMYYTQAVSVGMKQRGRGRIINVNSQAGIYAHAKRSVYHASKWAITGFTKALQEELREFGVAVTGFYPGAMNTQLFAKAHDTKDRSEALDPHAAADTLLYLCNLPDDVEVPELGLKRLSY